MNHGAAAIARRVRTRDVRRADRSRSWVLLLGVFVLAATSACASAGPAAPPPTGVGAVDPGTTDPGTTSPGTTSPATTSPATTDDDPASDAGARRVLDDALGRLLDASGADGGIVAYRRGDDRPTVVTAGVIDAGGAPMTTERPFPIASVTKSFTAALLVDLADDGLVDLDAPISTWIDWPDGDRITVRQLLLHTSGLGPWEASAPHGIFDAALFADLDVNHLLADVVELARGVAPVGAPGAQTAYSNLNYVLAGRIAELAGGAPYARLLADRITGALGLTATTYPAGDGPTSGAEPLPGTFEYPAGVLARTTDFPQRGFVSLMGPSAAAVSNVDDLFTWADTLFRTRRLGGTDLASLLRIGPGGTGLGVLGIDAQNGSCVFRGCPDGTTFEYLGLNGEAPGSAVRLWYDPATDLTVLVYLNRDGTMLDRSLIELVDRLASTG